MESACIRVVEASTFSNVYNLSEIYIVQAIVMAVEFPLSFIVMVLSFALMIFYRRRTTFLVRMYTYLTVPVTLLLGVCLLFSVPGLQMKELILAQWRDFCNSVNLYITGCEFAVWFAVMVLSYSICLSLLLKLCNFHCCTRYQQHWKRGSELLFIIILTISSLLIELMISLLLLNGIDYITVANTLPLHILIPIAVVIAWGPLAVGAISLLVWYCFRRRHILRRSFRAILKEIAFFLVLLLIAAVVSLFSGVPLSIAELSDKARLSPVGTQLILASVLTSFTICVFIYLWYSFRFRTAPRNRVRFANVDHRRNLRTAGLQTAPPSTRVSLPTDTAAHAPNFLSPSTAGPTEDTPLL